MATILPIITAPADILSHATTDVAPEQTSKHETLVADMGVTMEQADGIGLAAVQVDSSVRVAVIHRDVAGTTEHLVLFNPHIIWRSWRAVTDEEGCLSVPGVFGNVRRPSSVECSYVTTAGEAKTLKARGLLARVIQHEVDHLDGVLFVDRAESIVEGASKLQAWHKIP